MSRILKPTTIIPHNLYVERDADRQLNQIVEDMGRPGYVLVARQMGKTNLLINMKRRREAVGDVVLYFDLSNRAVSAKALFRSIIDAIIETDPVGFSDVESTIKRQRELDQWEANIEYDRHLRSLLKCANEKKIVIILDEIDSLVSVSYSDVVFAQIRSMYFSRVNYAEYERLTYVLSGVAEPTDLIKDKNISPFNIGEKIYLDDFSREETQLLVDRAKLNLKPEVVDTVFDWTSGNPRMTWDVLAEMERLEQNGSIISQSDVNAAVNKIFLTRFDRAPVDHIRVLVETDPLIRSSIISMRWGKGEYLEEKARSRLYLAGIVGASSHGIPVIKNKIIEAALSDSWIAQLSSATKNLLELASESFRAGEYRDANKIYLDFTRAQSNEADMPSASRFQFGLSYFHLRQYDEAIHELTLALDSTEFEEVRVATKYYIGMAHALAGRSQEAVPFFETAVNSKSPLHRTIKLALSSAYLSMAAEANAEKAINLLRDLIASSETSDKQDEEAAHVHASAHFNLARAFHALGDIKTRDRHIESALAVAPLKLKPGIAEYKYSFAETPSERHACAEDAGRCIIDHRLKYPREIYSSLSFNEIIFARVLSIVVATRNIGLAREMIHYACHSMYENTMSPAELLFKLVSSREIALDWKYAEALLWLALSFPEDDEQTLQSQISAAQALMTFVQGTRREEAESQFFVKLSKLLEGQFPVRPELLLPILNRVHDLNDQKKYRRAHEILQFARKVLERSGTDELTYHIAVLQQEMVIRMSLDDVKGAQSAASNLLSMTNPDQVGPDSEIASAVANMRRVAVNYMERPLPDPFRGIGRNEKVSVSATDGEGTRFVKFKHVERDLRSGRLKLIKSAKSS